MHSLPLPTLALGACLLPLSLLRVVVPPPVVLEVEVELPGVVVVVLLRNVFVLPRELEKEDIIHRLVLSLVRQYPYPSLGSFEDARHLLLACHSYL